MSITKEQLTEIIINYKRENKVPFIVEVLGTPNSGKTSAIQTFEKLLKRCNIKHKVIYEPASKCKVKNKLSPEFNLWTMSETIKQLLDVCLGSYDIIVCERGLLDSLCWFQLYYQEKVITADEFGRIHSFILLSRLIENIDCYYIFQSDVKTSLERESLHGLIDVVGTIVNENILKKYNSALDLTVKQHENDFKRIIRIDTSDMSQTEINREFTSQILQHLKLGWEKNADKESGFAF